MEMKVNDEDFDIPLYLHKPTMYKYEFTPDATISKGIELDRLPPVFIMALGPFKTRFGPYMEPPDKKYTDDPIPVETSFDREFANDSAKLEISAQGENVYTFTSISESVSLNNNNIFALYMGKEKTISKKQLKLLDDYGWSEVKVDTYVLKGDIFDKSRIQGEDHARVYFIDSALQSIGIKIEKGNDDLLKVTNTGNKKVDVSVDPVMENTCTFIFDEGNMSKNWIGSIDYTKSVNLTVSPKQGTKITVKVLIPEKVKDELERMGVPMTLKAQTS
jgi:archaellin